MAVLCWLGAPRDRLSWKWNQFLCHICPLAPCLSPSPWGNETGQTATLFSHMRGLVQPTSCRGPPTPSVLRPEEMVCKIEADCSSTLISSTSCSRTVGTSITVYSSTRCYRTIFSSTLFSSTVLLVQSILVLSVIPLSVPALSVPYCYLFQHCLFQHYLFNDYYYLF